MAWTFVRPSDPEVLAGRPLLDLGTGDGQTLAALVRFEGLVVGIDRSPSVLRVACGAGLSAAVAAVADVLPFRGAAFETVLAADLLHHLDDATLGIVLAAVRGVLRPGGRLVAWWYETPPREAPDAPAYTRSLDVVIRAAETAGLGAVEPLDLDIVLPGGPETVGLTACRER